VLTTLQHDSAVDALKTHYNMSISFHHVER